MKMADLIASNRDLILVLPRFGISLGFGDRSVKEVCRQHNVPLELFLLICNIYSFDGYVPDHEDIASIDVSSLVAYLQASHRYYLAERLPHMRRHLNNIVENAPVGLATALKSFFSDYQSEVAEHFDNEEKTLFPFLNDLNNKGRMERSLSDKFRQSHENMKDKLADLTQIIYKYLPGDILTEELMELVFGVLQLSTDLEKHALIEELLLFPSEDNVLSDRENEVLSYVAHGFSSKEIADRLHISLHTVNSHRKNIMRKTGIRSIAALTVYASLVNEKLKIKTSPNN